MTYKKVKKSEKKENKMEFNTFKEIKHYPLCVYNRMVMCHNLLEDFGKQTLENYLDIFSMKEKRDILLMNAYMQKHGVEATRMAVMRGFEPSYDIKQGVVCLREELKGNRGE